MIFLDLPSIWYIKGCKDMEFTTPRKDPPKCICWWKNDGAHQKIKLFGGCVWRVEVQNGSVLVPKPIFDGKLLMTSLPHLKNLHFWVSFRKHK